jgi:hypothetical protein
MVDCQLDLDVFKKLLSEHSVQVLRLWDCSFYSSGAELDLSLKEIDEELSVLAPNFRCYEDTDIDANEDPHLNWDFAYR